MSKVVNDVYTNITLFPPGPTETEEGYTNNTFTFHVHEPDEENALRLTASVLIGLLLSLVIFASISGNLLVCLAIYTDRRLRKIGNIFLASLALADLFVAALVEPFALTNDMMNRWIFGIQFCETWIAFDVMCSTASILNLCSISLDRFIKDPLRYGRWMTRKVVIGSVAGIWLLSALVSFLPISLGWHKPKKGTILDDEQCALDLTPTYAVVSSCISFCLPCLVMITLYARIYMYAKLHVKSIRAVTKPPLINGRNSESSVGSASHQTMDHKAAITLGIIMGTFLVCWVPFFCVNVIAAFCKTCVSDLTFKGFSWLGYLNSALNPIIYSIFNTDFRYAFKRIIVAYAKGDCCRNDRDFRRGSRASTDTRLNLRRFSQQMCAEVNQIRVECVGEFSDGSTEI